MSSHAQTRGIHHVGLTVPDVAVTARFFQQELGFQRVAEKPDYPAIFVSDGSVLLTLWQAENPTTAVAFDRRRVVGLHHLALAVSDDALLDPLHDRLTRYDGVHIEFPPESLGHSGLRHFMCTIPGGIRLELVSSGRES